MYSLEIFEIDNNTARSVNGYCFPDNVYNFHAKNKKKCLKKAQMALEK